MEEFRNLKKHEGFLTLKRDLATAVQASYVVEEWVDQALYKFKEEESRSIATTKAQAEAEKKYKESLFRLAEVERGRKSVEAALGIIERQAKEQRIQLRSAEEELAIAKKKIELQLKKLEGKEAELSKAEQATYELGQKETSASLTLQIRLGSRVLPPSLD